MQAPEKETFDNLSFRPSAGRNKGLYILLKNILFILLITALPFAGKGQPGQKATAFITQKIEELSEKYELNIDYSDLLNVLLYYYKNPLNLNTATKEQLRSLGFFNEMQINNLLKFRKKNGLFQSIYELKDVEGFDYNFIMDVRVFIEVAPPQKKEKLQVKHILKYGRNDIFMRYGRVLQEQKGYAPVSDSALAANPNSRYLGSPAKLWFRYRFTYRDRISIGLVGDKDAGEQFFRGSNPAGFDFYTAHLYLHNFGKLKSFVAGDYHLEFGQGLTLWSGLGFGKSVDVLGVQKTARGLTPNTSTNENLYFRGAAATVELWEPLKVTLFYSNKGLDAGLLQDTLDAEEFYFQSIQETGMHRTPAEVAKKNAVKEQLFGGNLSYDKSGLHLGFTAYKTLYDKSLQASTLPYKHFNFTGNSNFNAGVNFSWSMQKMLFFGEIALSRNGGRAGLGGIIADLSPRFKMSLVYRDFQPAYQVLYAIPFAESTGAKNEKGLFVGTKIYTGAKGLISAYYDIFSFPWLRYRVNTPSEGNEFLLQYENEISRHFDFYVRAKSETKALNYSDVEKQTASPTPLIRRSLRLNLRYEAGRSFGFQTRTEIMHYEHKPCSQSTGYLMFQDVRYRPQALPFDLTFRYAVFSTDDYDSRIYAYENDVLYKFSIPAYYGKGQRFYLMLHYDAGKHIDLWLRFSNTSFADRQRIGSSLEEIEGNNKSEVTAQVRIKF